jgi:hypothetical protein
MIASSFGLIVSIAALHVKADGLNTMSEVGRIFPPFGLIKKLKPIEGQMQKYSR